MSPPTFRPLVNPHRRPTVERHWAARFPLCHGRVRGAKWPPLTMTAKGLIDESWLTTWSERLTHFLTPSMLNACLPFCAVILEFKHPQSDLSLCNWRFHGVDNIAPISLPSPSNIQWTVANWWPNHAFTFPPPLLRYGTWRIPWNSFDFFSTSQRIIYNKAWALLCPIYPSNVLNGPLQISHQNNIWIS